VAYCGIVELPEEVGALKALRVLNAEFNELKDIPASLGYLPELISLRCERRGSKWRACCWRCPLAAAGGL
jgi:hypothetical protein